MKVLTIDISAHFGFSLVDDQTGQIFDSGTWELKTPSKADKYAKLPVLRECLNQLYAQHGDIGRVVYEDVEFSTTQLAHASYSRLLAVCLLWAIDTKLPYSGIEVAAIKKHVTGAGNADKEAVMAAMRVRYPQITLIDDNHADALAICACVTDKFDLAAPTLKAMRKQAKRVKSAKKNAKAALAVA